MVIALLVMIALLAYIFYPFFFDLLRQMFKLNHDQVAPFVVKMLNFTDKKVINKTKRNGSVVPSLLMKEDVKYV